MNTTLKWDQVVKPAPHTRFYSCFVNPKHCSGLQSDHFWLQTVIFPETDKKTINSPLRHIDVESDILIFETAEIA